MRAETIVMSCLHTRLFKDTTPPATGETIWCPECGDYKEVAQAPHDYSIHCETCGYRRQYGNAPLSAETMAVSHSLRKAGHRLVLYDFGEEVQVYQQKVIEFDVPSF